MVTSAWLLAGGVRAVEGAKMKNKPNLLSKSVSRIELEQRSREARLRIERIERLLTPPITRRSPASANLPLAVSR
jgi:hypothetical protein